MRKLVFIVGVEGSGTTMMCRLLGSMDCAEVLLGNFNSLQEQRSNELKAMPETVQAMADIAQGTTDLWDRDADGGQVLQAAQACQRAVQVMLGTPELDGVSHIVLKRSAPFFVGERYRPDLLDIAATFPEARILLMTRGPKASTYSAYRRNFVKNLRHGALICEDQLLHFAAKLEVLEDDQVLLVNYEQFCADPGVHLRQVAEFCDLDSNVLSGALQSHPILPHQNRKWRQELGDEDQAFLDNFFSPQRLQQFERLGLASDQ